MGVAPNPNTRSPTSTSVDRGSAAAGDNKVREPVTDYHRDGALTAVSAAVTLGTAVPVPGAVCAVRSRNPTQVTTTSCVLKHSGFDRSKAIDTSKRSVLYLE